MKRVMIGLIAVAAALVAAGSASAHVHDDPRRLEDRIVRGQAGRHTRWSRRGVRKPDSRNRHGVSCTVRWARHGLKIVFYNLGGENPCRRSFGFFSKARATGPHWKTNRDLKIGNGQRRLRNLYPNARFHSGEESVFPPGWWLVTRRSQVGTGGRYPGLLAKVLGGRVSQFQVRYPAGGD